MLGWPEAGRILRRAEMAQRVREASHRFGLDLDPDALVADLPLGRRQRVEILKAVLRDAQLLILDEPTSNLAPSEVSELLVDPSSVARGGQRHRLHHPQAAGSPRSLRPRRRVAGGARLGRRAGRRRHEGPTRGNDGRARCHDPSRRALADERARFGSQVDRLAGPGLGPLSFRGARRRRFSASPASTATVRSSSLRPLRACGRPRAGAIRLDGHDITHAAVAGADKSRRRLHARRPTSDGAGQEPCRSPRT